MHIENTSDANHSQNKKSGSLCETEIKTAVNRKSSMKIRVNKSLTLCGKKALT